MLRKSFLKLETDFSRVESGPFLGNGVSNAKPKESESAKEVLVGNNEVEFGITFNAPLLVAGVEPTDATLSISLPHHVGNVDPASTHEAAFVFSSNEVNQWLKQSHGKEWLVRVWRKNGTLCLWR